MSPAVPVVLPESRRDLGGHRERRRFSAEILVLTGKGEDFQRNLGGFPGKEVENRAGSRDHPGSARAAGMAAAAFRPGTGHVGRRARSQAFGTGRVGRGTRSQAFGTGHVGRGARSQVLGTDRFTDLARSKAFWAGGAGGGARLRALAESLRLSELDWPLSDGERGDSRSRCRKISTATGRRNLAEDVRWSSRLGRPGGDHHAGVLERGRGLEPSLSNRLLASGGGKRAPRSSRINAKRESGDGLGVAGEHLEALVGIRGEGLALQRWKRARGCDRSQRLHVLVIKLRRVAEHERQRQELEAWAGAMGDALPIGRTLRLLREWRGLTQVAAGKLGSAGRSGRRSARRVSAPLDVSFPGLLAFVKESGHELAGGFPPAGMR